MKNILIKTFIFSIVLGAITAGLRYSDTIPLIHHQWHFILLFYFVLTGFVFYKLLQSLQKEPRKFFFSFLSISGLRMLLFIAIILLYTFLIQSDTQNTVSFIITFTAYYLIFATWEVFLIVSTIKRKKPSS